MSDALDSSFSLPQASTSSPVQFDLSRLEIICADITTLQVDAIVNAANERLAGGGGVDGAIHRAAGQDKLQAHTQAHHPQGCPTGLAVMTPAFDLGPNIKQIIHTVGPVWQGDGGTFGTSEEEKLGNRHEDVLLASCYLRCVELCRQNNLKTIAFPAISTGVYGFPKDRAAKVAIGHLLGILSAGPLPELVTLCCFDETDRALWQATLDQRQDWLFNRKRA